MSNCITKVFYELEELFESATTKMLSLLAWCGFLPKKLHEWEVYSKLGGNFLGRVHKVYYADAYTMVRSLQDQIALFYKHARRPPRYIAIFVDQTRLTSPSFPFVDKLDLQEAEKVFAAFGGARRIDVYWDESDDYTKHWLGDEGLYVQQTGTRLVVKSGRGLNAKYNQALPLQLEIFALQATPIKRIKIVHDAHDLNGVDMFPHLEELSCRAENVDFAALSRSKVLVFLDLEVPILAHQVGVMHNLQTLKVKVTTASRVPTELGLLTNLSKLVLTGRLTGGLLSIVGNMQALVELTMESALLSELPVGLCKLCKLPVLTHEGNLATFASADAWPR